MRGAVFIGPVIAFIITRRWCISLQRHDEEKLLHGYESGVLVRSPEGGYAEKHLPSPRPGLHIARPATATRSRSRSRGDRGLRLAGRHLRREAAGQAADGVLRGQRPEAHGRGAPRGAAPRRARAPRARVADRRRPGTATVRTEALIPAARAPPPPGSGAFVVRGVRGGGPAGRLRRLSAAWYHGQLRPGRHRSRTSGPSSSRARGGGPAGRLRRLPGVASSAASTGTPPPASTLRRDENPAT